MVLEYLLYSEEAVEKIKQYNKTIVLPEKSIDVFSVTIKRSADNSFWVVRYEVRTNNINDAKMLSCINGEIIGKYKPTVLSNESAQYFNKKLYDIVNKFERLLRKFLFLKVAQVKDEKCRSMVQNIEAKDFGDIYNILFVDNSYDKEVKKIMSNLHTKEDFLEAINTVEEKTVWSILVSDDSLSVIRDNFMQLKDYRNDVMHAHNIGYEVFEKANKLFSDANTQLEAEINEIIEIPLMSEKSSDYADVLYDKLRSAQERKNEVYNDLMIRLNTYRDYYTQVLPGEEMLKAYTERIAEYSDLVNSVNSSFTNALLQANQKYMEQSEMLSTLSELTVPNEIVKMHQQEMAIYNEFAKQTQFEVPNQIVEAYQKNMAMYEELARQAELMIPKPLVEEFQIPQNYDNDILNREKINTTLLSDNSLAESNDNQETDNSEPEAMEVANE